MNVYQAVAAALTLALGAGCASSPDKIPTSYVSPIQYRDYGCDQIAAELGRLNRRTQELHGSLKQKADNDNAQAAVGLLLFWPALFMLEGGDGPEASEYGRLKGEREVLEQLAIQKQCVEVEPQAPAGAETGASEAREG